jgi:flagellar basal-body rod modification protein FlgD
MLDPTQALFTQAAGLGDAATDKNPNASLGKGDFLNLLVTQMQYQDPLDPMKNEQFVAQMAQFSQLEQMINLNDTATSIKMLETSINNSQAVNLIGKNIIVQGNAFELHNGEATDVTYALEDDAASVEISVYDDAGTLVRTITRDDTDAGSHKWAFDGMNKEGDAVPASTYSSVRVDGLAFDNGTLYLQAAGGRFRLSDIVEVSE